MLDNLTLLGAREAYSKRARALSGDRDVNLKRSRHNGLCVPADPRAMVREIQALRDHSSKVKVAYLEQDTKMRFLELMAQEDIYGANQHEIEIVQVQNAQTKQALRAQKSLVRDLEVEMETLGHEVSTEYQRLTIQEQETERLGRETEAMENEIRDLEMREAQLDVPVHQDPVVNSLSPSELERQAQQYKQEWETLDLQLQELRALTIHTQQEKVELEMAVAGLEENKRILEKSAREVATLREQQLATGLTSHHDVAASWFRSVNRILSSLTGIESVVVRPSQIDPTIVCVGFQRRSGGYRFYEGPEQHNVQVDIDKFSGRIMQITGLGDVSGILARAQHMYAATPELQLSYVLAETIY